MKLRLILSLLFLILSPTVQALELFGYAQQGGYLMGHTVPDAQITFGDAKTKADETGTFLIGIPRDQAEKSQLSIMLMGGIEEKHDISIAQNNYKTQAIKGVQDKHVTPRSKVDLDQIASDTYQINAARGVFESLPFIQTPFAHPVHGKITGVYGSRRTYNGEERNWHKGADFAAPRGTKIQAPAAGVVRLALKNSFFNGNLVIIDHGYQLMTIYAHMDSISVQVGDKVEVGDILGTLGSTGRSTGPHLHWGLYWRNMALNPMLLLQKQATLNE